MISEVTREDERSEAYGILHTLDIMGASLAILYLTIALYLGIEITLVVLLTAIPLAISTILLAMVKAGGKGKPALMARKGWILVISTTFFAFSQYSFVSP